ncbi:FAD-dependent monooxygenase [Sulfitobacter sp. F26204]|uniref:FAD-dependent monooxygenase n=1 Tax=Sulfitobacter sp. F26204 TaxID=2996014 RepID=UPI00225E5A43|nr:FAD-dependent monooxygenase [Sulfitobacter sp. F26204]MCX7559955.1 FAD-dependent monooxygenase [Sulfitobacter sp. F26204]
MNISNAIVVGGGIGGLSVAAAMARHGIAVTLLERAPVLGEVGAGLQVSPNGLAVLRALGLEAGLRRKEAVQGTAVVLRDHATGAQVARLPLDRLPVNQRYFFVHRADLVDLLAGAARRGNVTFEMGAQVASIRPGAIPQVQMTDGSTRRAELVVAADGIHSVGRPVLNGPDAAAFSGQVAWRAIVANRFDHPPEAQVHMGTGRHLVSYPLRGGALVNLVAVQEQAGWAEEGWFHKDDPAHVQAAFSEFGGIAGAMLADVDMVTLWGLHLHPVAAQWQRQGVALLGDAAHPTLPFLAQGANMALEDAWVLAEQAAKGYGDWLAGYQQRRQARVIKVIAAAQKNAARYHLPPGAKRSLAHFGLRLGSKLAPRRMIGAFDWLYGFDVTAQQP